MTRDEATRLEKAIKHHRGWAAWRANAVQNKIPLVWCTRYDQPLKIYHVSTYAEFVTLIDKVDKV